MAHLTSLVATFILIIASASLAIGLTYLPCYATICSEDYFPFETRLHIATYYGLLVVGSCLLLLQASTRFGRSLSRSHLSPVLPVLGKRITVGDLTISLLVISTTLATTSVWLPAQVKFWGARTDPLEWDTAKIRLTVTGITGHYADILLGLLLIPVSRNSLVGQSFGVHQSTLLSAHKLIAYLFLAATLAHGVAYGLYALDPSSEGDVRKEQAFATGNPAMTLEESEKRSSWYTQTTYTGAATLVVLLLIVLTALPFVRCRFYNVFYFSHVIISILILVGAGIHASTDIYLLIPGLVLWTVDWAIRLFGGEAGGLHKTQVVSVEDASNGWYRISLPAQGDHIEKYRALISTEKKSAPGDALACYYLNFPAVNKMENHPFTAAIPGSMSSGPVFLFQPAQGKNQKKLDKEWTWKLAALTSTPGGRSDLRARIEGPYRPSDTGYETAFHIICIVGGTGITGAYSLAMWWIKARGLTDDSKFTLIWSIRHEEMAHLKEWQELKAMAETIHSLNVVEHISSLSERLDPSKCIRQCLELGQECETMRIEAHRSCAGRVAWVYSSGPDGLISATESACVAARQEIHDIVKNGREPAVLELDWYMAKWEV
ncbi:unnamed protein product [Clonostachys rhizophaga]|uniref:Ferric oxidoreductase domain-containing protein n=1 Tax=Clonostachys rhizophaga TaxID=160324 RepID=A0A9N9VYG2_9HYPO|nr:unnamed protein product [Clonostachys rhizophaga]